MMGGDQGRSRQASPRCRRTLATTAAGPTVTVLPAPPPSFSQGVIPVLQTPEDTTATFDVSDVVAEVGVVGTPGHTYGLAVDGVDDTHGTWQYSLDDATWAPLSAAIADERPDSSRRARSCVSSRPATTTARARSAPASGTRPIHHRPVRR